MSSASTERRLELPEWMLELLELHKTNLNKTTNASQGTVKEPERRLELPERRLELPELHKTNLNKTTNASQSTVKDQRLGISQSDQSIKLKKSARRRVRIIECDISEFRKIVQDLTGFRPAGGGGGEEREKGLGDGDDNKGHPCGEGVSPLAFLSDQSLLFAREASSARFLEKRCERPFPERRKLFQCRKSDENKMQPLLKEKSISDQPVTNSVGSSNSLGSGLCSHAAEDQKELKPFFGIDLHHARASYVMNEGSLLSDLKEEENAMVSSEAEKVEAMQKQRAESDSVPMQNAQDTETELFPCDGFNWGWA